jgi:WD40 repeat protein
MQHRATLLLVCCVALVPTLPAECAQQPDLKPLPARSDLFGDPLPEGASARLGSVRFHHQGGVIAAAFAPDGQTIVAAGFEKDGLSLRLWETATGKETSRIAVQGSELRGLTFAPDGKTVFVGRAGCVEQYDRQNGKLVCRFAEKPTNGLFAVSADGKWLATTVQVGWSSVIHVWDIATGKELVSCKGQDGAIVKCQWSADGKRLLSASTSISYTAGNKIQKIQGSICVWDVAAGKKLHAIANDGWNVALARDGQTTAIQEQNGDTCVVNVVTGRTTCAFKSPRSALEFTPDNKALIAVDFYGNDPPCLRDATTGKELRRFQGQHAGIQRLAGFSCDGKLLVAMAGGWNQDGSVLLWNVATGEPLHHPGGHLDTVTGLAFSPSARLLASGSLDCTVRLWDPATGKPLARLEGHKTGITAIAFSRDGQTLASSSSDGHIRLWDTAKQRELAKLDGPAGGAASLTFSQDGKTLLVGGKSPVIQVWDVLGLKRISSFPTGHDGSVFAFRGYPESWLALNPHFSA